MTLDIQEQTELISLAQESFTPVVYRNPIPVAVLLQPVLGIDPEDWQRKIGLVVVERAIPPIGGLAFPGGYMDEEDWRDAAVREYCEELELNIPQAGKLKLFDVHSVQSGKRLIVFAEAPIIYDLNVEAFVPNSEVNGVRVIYHPVELCFSSHTEVMRKFFEKEGYHREHRALPVVG